MKAAARAWVVAVGALFVWGVLGIFVAMVKSGQGSEHVADRFGYTGLAMIGAAVTTALVGYVCGLRPWDER